MSAFQCSILTFAESQLEEVERPKSFRFFKLGAKTTQQLNYMMEAFDRQVVEPEGEGAAGNELPDEEDMPEGVRRYFRNCKLRVSFTYSQNFQFLVKKSMDVGGSRVFILKSVSGQMTDLWVEGRKRPGCPALPPAHAARDRAAGSELGRPRTGGGQVSTWEGTQGRHCCFVGMHGPVECGSLPREVSARKTSCRDGPPFAHSQHRPERLQEACRMSKLGEACWKALKGRHAFAQSRNSLAAAGMPRRGYTAQDDREI